MTIFLQALFVTIIIDAVIWLTACVVSQDARDYMRRIWTYPVSPEDMRSARFGAALDVVMFCLVWGALAL